MNPAIARALNLREGEGRTLVVMAGFLLLNTANTTVLSAAKNGLFLSVYPGELIPHAVIAAALLTALIAVVFTSYVAGTARRSLAVGLTIALGVSVVACRVLFAVDPRASFVVYLWLSAVQVLILTHAWDYAGDLLTGRQAKRLLPLIGVGASVGAIVGGTGVAPAALGLGTDNLLWISVALLLGALPLLWAIPEPIRDREEGAVHPGAARAFVQRASRGIRSVGGNKLLRLMAVGLVALTLTGTLIDLQLKFLLQETYSRDRITVIYGLLSAAVGAGTLVLQLWASRVLFPKFGVSFAAVLHGGALTLAAGGVAVFGGLTMLVAAQALDDILQFSLQKPVEQVSLLPFPGRVKSVALATLGGVLRPLSKASAGGIALGLSGTDLLPLATVAAAITAAVTYSLHRGRYLSALESALVRNSADFTSPDNVPLVADAGALTVIDRALRDPDPTVAVFATSLLEQLPSADALPRVVALLGHDVAEVRAEAARVLRLIDTPLDFGSGVAVAGRLAVEEAPLVIAQLLESIGTVGGVDPTQIERYAAHDDAGTRTAALVALGRLGWTETERRLRALLGSDTSADRAIGARAVGELKASALLDDLTPVLSDDHARPAALAALSSLGPPAVPVMADLLARKELPLPLRRSVVTAMAGVEGSDARNALVNLLGEPLLAPAALTSLTRMRSAGAIDAIDSRRLRTVLDAEIRSGLKYAATSSELRRTASCPSDTFVVEELEGLRDRSVLRVLKLLGLSHDTTRLSTVSVAIASSTPAHRSHALELLEGTLPRADAPWVMPFLEAVADGFPLHRVTELLDDHRTIRAQPGAALLEEAEWWPRALGLHQLGRGDEVTAPDPSICPSAKDDPMIPLIEKVMILKGSEFFRNFPGSDLAGIASHADVVYAGKREVIFEQDADGDAFYVVVQGAIEITRGSTHLATLGPREGFGEMALLDRETRSATATASEETTLLRLDRDSFDRVVEQNPVVARGIYRVLTERLRNTLAQVAAG